MKIISPRYVKPLVHRQKSNGDAGHPKMHGIMGDFICNFE